MNLGGKMAMSKNYRAHTILILETLVFLYLLSPALASVQIQYTYDDLNRLIQVSESDTSIDYTYDEVGNIVSEIVSAPVLVAVTVAPVSSLISLNDRLIFTATATYDNGTKADVTLLATWSSSNTTVATIDGAGVAKGIGVGVTYISAVFRGMTSSTALTVTTRPPLEVAARRAPNIRQSRAPSMPR